MTKKFFGFSASLWVTTKRIETLADGIFAIAMTLLVLSIGVPQIAEPVSSAALQQSLIDLIPKFFSYALSFVLLAVFWRINHQQFYVIKRADTTLLWINILWLLFVALVPFSTSLIGEYGEYQITEVFFHLNLLAIGLFCYLNWHYATESNFVDKSLDSDAKTSIKRGNLVLPITSLLAIAISFISPSWSSMAYLFIPFIKKI